MKHETPLSRQHVLVARARRAAGRGENRQAMVALREACALADDDARLWALYGHACARLSRNEDAERAFRQALYLRHRQQDAPRAAVLRAIIERLQLGRAA